MNVDKILIKINEIKKQIKILENEKDQIKIKYEREEKEKYIIEKKINECERKIEELNKTKEKVEIINKTKWAPKTNAILDTILSIIDIFLFFGYVVILKDKIILGILFGLLTPINILQTIDNFKKTSANKKFLKNNNIEDIEKEKQEIYNEKADYQKLYDKKSNYLQDLYLVLVLKTDEIDKLNDDINNLSN